MRVFLAVGLDPDARASIKAVSERLRRRLGGKGPRVTWVGDEQLHVTLHFLGEIEDARVARLRTALERPLAQPPFHLTMRHAGVFPPDGAPRVIWVGLDEGGAQLAAIHRELAERLQTIPCDVDTRPFSPHVTIARIRSRGHDSAAPVLSTTAIDPAIESRVDHVTAYESRLTRDGPVYRELARTLCSSR